MKKVYSFTLTLAALLFIACSDYEYTDETTQTIGTGSAHLRVNVTPFEFLPFDTRGSATLGSVSTRMSYTFFQMDGETKVMTTKSVTSDDKNYGTIDVRLDPGQYIMLTVAHNGTANCTISSPTEVKFASNHITDTFTSCDTINVEAGEQVAYITLKRRVAMLRLVVEEALPEEVQRIKFYYTGGSSTLDPSTGFGSVNSRQTEILNVPASAHESKNSVYEVYTFPHAETGTLKVTITAYDANDNVVSERSLPNVPIRLCEITQCRGTLTGNSTLGQQFELTVDDTDWTQTNYTF